jgi:DNA mismatch repair protein MutS
MFATHYHELTQLAGRLARLVNVQVAVRERGDQVVFLHRIVDGAADRSYGIQVARLAGLPPWVIERAREVLAELEAERTAEQLESHARPAAAQRQIGLFDQAHPLLAELAALDPERLTPLDALTRLSEWKRLWGGEA